MKRQKPTFLFASLGLTALLVLALVAAGCTGTGQKTTPPAATQAPQAVATAAVVPQSTAPQAQGASAPAAIAAPVSGEKQSIRVSGSTTVLPIAQKAAEAYMAAHPNADIQVTGGGSGVGIQQIGEKTVDVGMSSRELSSTEKTKYPGLVKSVVAKDGIAVIVNRANEISVISADNIKNIYTGRITKWSQVFGANVPNTNQQIVVIGRDSASGTREFFDKAPEGILKGAVPVKSMLEKNSNGAVTQTVAQTPGAIGYVSIGFITADVKALPIWYNNPNDAIAPTAVNVKSKKYPINRELFMFTNGAPAGLAKDYIDFIRSPEGQKIVSDEGYVSIID
ncbi:MAG: phosphate ABC transporter periplasmic substrate-binding protein PstS [Methanoregula sp. PtaU1.Bin051]|nr:MAG: phosphate ABC transporter periplasmic substrate-binding protein PstS [Methanoregula sp. PtaU1.Bin051]